METNCAEGLRTKVRKDQKVTEIKSALNRGVAPGSSQVVTVSVLSGFGPCVALWPARVCLLLTAHCPPCILSLAAVMLGVTAVGRGQGVSCEPEGDRLWLRWPCDFWIVCRCLK